MIETCDLCDHNMEVDEKYYCTKKKVIISPERAMDPSIPCSSFRKEVALQEMADRALKAEARVKELELALKHCGRQMQGRYWPVEGK